jgi:glutaredoxin
LAFPETLQARSLVIGWRHQLAYIPLLVVALFVAFFPAWVCAQNDPWEGTVYGKMSDILTSKEERAEQKRQEAEEQRKLEEEVIRQREEMRQNPGKFPRRRMSYEAETSNNPWVKQTDDSVPSGVRVEIFVADQCPDCEKMEKYLDDVGVPYSRNYLSPETDAEQRYLTQIGRGILPAVRINRKVIRGYQPEEVRRIILQEKQENNR